MHSLHLRMPRIHSNIYYVLSQKYKREHVCVREKECVWGGERERERDVFMD